MLECLAAVKGAAEREDAEPALDHSMPRTTVLIPARDEAVGIARTIASVRAAGWSQMQVLVVADNCRDETAEIARASGVTVIERQDMAHTGKGYALAFGMEYLAHDPPDVVIMVDADTMVDREALRLLARRAEMAARPVQAAYRWEEVRPESSAVALSNFAFLVKNIVRPTGLAKMGAPCLLTGSGMALPWAALEGIALATGHLSEDMWLSVELTCAGSAPMFFPEARVFGRAPRRREVIFKQRTRWEQGHLATMGRGIPKLVLAGFKQGRAEPLWLALELSIPPLALLVSLVTLGLLLSVGFFGLSGAWLPLLTSAVSIGCLFVAVLAAWWKFGRQELPAQTLLAVPGYVRWKIPIYFNTLLHRRARWTRTERDSDSAPDKA